MNLVVVKIVTLNQCGVIWNKITEVAAMLPVISDKTGKRVNLLGQWKKDQTFLEILGSIAPRWQSSAGWMP